MISTAPVYIDHQFSGLSQLKLAARNESPAALKEAARLFEAQFIQMLMKSMRASSHGDALFGSDQTRFYEEMYDKEISNTLAKTGRLGLANLLVTQLQRLQAGDSLPGITAADVALSPLKDSDDKRMSVGETIHRFIDDVWQGASEASIRLNIDAQILVAQSALETGWGLHMGKTESGHSTFNYLGIKAGNQWQGDSSSQATREFNGQFLQMVTDDFRSYASVEQSFADYADFILTNPRYAELPGSDADSYTQRLQQLGYATDPEYAKKIAAIMNNPYFQQKMATLNAKDLSAQVDN